MLTVFDREKALPNTINSMNSMRKSLYTFRAVLKHLEIFKFHEPNCTMGVYVNLNYLFLIHSSLLIRFKGYDITPFHVKISGLSNQLPGTYSTIA